MGRKRPDLLPALEVFLTSIEYELASPGDTVVAISDPNDQPVVDAATASAVDVIVTGDKHFLTLDIEAPRILTARAFVEAYAEPT